MQHSKLSLWILLLLCLSPIPFSLSVSAETLDDCRVTALYGSANIRSGAGMDFEVIGEISNDAVQVVGQVSESSYIWWQLTNNQGYVRSDVAIAVGSCSYQSSSNWLSIPAIDVELPLTVCEYTNGNWSVEALGSNSCLLSGFEGIDRYFQSVITAHAYDSYGNHLAFARLGNLLAGDRIYVTYNGQVYEFEVASSLLTSPDNFRALLSPDSEGLALITCAGEWSILNNDYSQRQVVYATRIGS